MPSHLYIAGDHDPFWCMDNPIAVLDKIASADGLFVTLTQAPEQRGGVVHTAYVRVDLIAAVEGITEAEWEWNLNQPPYWADTEEEQA